MNITDLNNVMSGNVMFAFVAIMDNTNVYLGRLYKCMVNSTPIKLSQPFILFKKSLSPSLYKLHLNPSNPKALIDQSINMSSRL